MWKSISDGKTLTSPTQVDIDHLVSVLRVSIQRADAMRLASDTVVSLMPQVS